MNTAPDPRPPADSGSEKGRAEEELPRCPSCETGYLVNLRLTTDDGRQITMTMCPHCERREWALDGTPVPLQVVLPLVAGQPLPSGETPTGRKRRRR